MLNIGMMNRSITIERKTETVSPSGDPRETWTPVATVRAELIQQTASEFFTGFGEAETGTVIFRVRYRPGITTADRVTYDGTAYGIKEIKTIGRRHALELRGEALT
ncbi:phage head closure protein [Rhizobium pusense]|uniref:Phage head-tail adaptor n=1 Tax=Agrobacterium genomosp. 2 str. CFBP 5494 TaxID=1183436 RepID=A0A9W5AZV2_9HYPH|nr:MULTISPECIES: phage head closure protein [Rhizobium/Agrobacterium group]MDH0907735.1 phage head closure protein [Agrobacterium pusense]MDH1094425.1 phage head closure protein [Agrobacterium pusense]MDH1111650.1 phage head closure protein [Agrobacterium pusense]MDH2192405.1 phage head closure protein [Agrobacterium pusense]OJH53436.1 head-tail adaptor protein [Agrobacterium pusense]